MAGFCRALSADGALQASLQSCITPAAICALAAEHGFVFSSALLRAYAMDLSSPWWPWAGSGVDGRHAFFSRPTSG